MAYRRSSRKASGTIDFFGTDLSTKRQAPWVARAGMIWKAHVGPSVSFSRIGKALKLIMENEETDHKVAFKAIDLYLQFRPYRDSQGTFANWDPTGQRAPNMFGVTPNDLAASWQWWYDLASDVLSADKHLLYVRPELFHRRGR